MKKKVIIVLVSCFILITSIIYLIIKNNESNYIITLDINPSIQINLDKNNVVKKVIALNKDAKEIVSNDLKNISLNKTISIIADRVIEKGFISDGEVSIVYYTNNKTNEEETINFIIDSFESKDIRADLIVIEKINPEDKKIAKKYNISPAKASYINSVVKEHNSVSIENLANRSVGEIRETKQNGWYCNEGYILEGSNCLKEIGRSAAKIGDVCPNGYYNYNNKCYEETLFKEGNDLVCSADFTLKDDKCVKEDIIEAEPKYSCSKGELKTKRELFMTGDMDDNYYCVDKTNAKPPTLRCLTHNHTMINGKCANGPKPTINGGCIEGDYLVNGGCYDIDNEDQWVCPDGNIYEKSKGTYVELCPDTMTYTKPTITGYGCPTGFKLKNNKCIRKEVIEPSHERHCESRYNLVDNDRCINFSKTAEMQEGYVCDKENSRLRGNVCVSYEMVEANKS